MNRPWPSHGRAVGIPWAVRGMREMPMGCPWEAHRQTMDSQSTDSPRAAHAHPTDSPDCPWASRGHPTASHGQPMGIPWSAQPQPKGINQWSTMSNLRTAHGRPMGIPGASYWKPMGSPWAYHGHRTNRKEVSTHIEYTCLL